MGGQRAHQLEGLVERDHLGEWRLLLLRRRRLGSHRLEAGQMKRSGATSRESRGTAARWAGTGRRRGGLADELWCAADSDRTVDQAVGCSDVLNLIHEGRGPSLLTEIWSDPTSPMRPMRYIFPYKKNQCAIYNRFNFETEHTIILFLRRSTLFDTQ